MRITGPVPVTYQTGTLLTWDAGTFANRVRLHDGAVADDLPVAGGAEALAYAPGQTVKILEWNGSLWIDGQIITPGSGAAEKAIQFLETQFARQIVDELVAELLGTPAGGLLIRGLLGQAIAFDFVATAEQQGDTNSNWVDLPSSGPSVSSVTIGDSGRALVLLAARMTSSAASGSPGGATLESGLMSVEVSGASSQAPRAFEAYELSTQIFTDTGQVTTSQSLGSTRAVLLDDLNAGDHTLTAKYQVLTSPSTEGTVTFSDRLLIAIPF